MNLISVLISGEIYCYNGSSNLLTIIYMDLALVSISKLLFKYIYYV